MTKYKRIKVKGSIDPTEIYEVNEITSDFDEPETGEISFLNVFCPRFVDDIDTIRRLISEGALCKCRIECEDLNPGFYDTIYGPKKHLGCIADKKYSEWGSLITKNIAEKYYVEQIKE
jgi:hypothetical protein